MAGRWIGRLVTVALGIGLAGAGWGQLTQAEREGLSDALFLANLGLGDLATERNPFGSLVLTGILGRGLNDPLGAVDELMVLHGRARGESPSQLLSAGLSSLRGAEVVMARAPREVVNVSGGSLPEDISSILVDLAADVLAADKEIRGAVSGLSPAEFRVLVESLAVVGVEEEKVGFGFVRGRTVGLGELQGLVSRIDRARIWRAGILVQKAVEDAVVRLRESKGDVSGKVRLTVGGLPVVVAGRGSDVHDELDARITIDLGGDDVYRGRHGAGVGYAGVLIDMGGDDRVDVPDLSVGAGVAGVGCAWFEEGNDSFRGGSLCFGAGLAGVGVMTKIGGEDVYRSVALSQGFGMFGAGILYDTAGNDLYSVQLFGQGAGRTDGVGWLVDLAGDDTYRAGGLSMNEPLFSGVSYSFAQGFGMGYREDSGGVAGGVGLLTDVSGSDRYMADTYGQAASYWFGVGSLWDGAGNDVYSAHHYAQGSAMHLTGAYFFELGGDDVYALKVGAGQGIGHDYGVAFVLDREGDDLWASGDSRPGTGVANGWGVFIDAGGNDKYTALPAFGRRDRSQASFGVFADLGGVDSYPAGFGDGVGLVSGFMGSGFDRDGGLRRTGSGQAGVVQGGVVQGGTGEGGAGDFEGVRPGSVARPSDAELARLFGLASRWGVGSAQAGVEEAVRELVGIGGPAVEWILENRLAGAERLEVRAIGRIVRGVGAEAVAALGRRALMGSDAELEGAIRVAMEAGVADMGAVLPRVIREKPGMRVLAVRAAGVLRARGAAEAIMPLLLERDPVLVRTAMAALAEIGEASTVGTAASLLRSADPVVRASAVELIVKHGEQAVRIGEALLAETDEGRARIGVEILGRVNMYGSLETVGAALGDPRPGVRVTALQQLAGRCPAAYREAFLALREDPLPVVRAVARGVEP